MFKKIPVDELSNRMEKFRLEMNNSIQTGSWL